MLHAKPLKAHFNNSNNLKIKIIKLSKSWEGKTVFPRVLSCSLELLHRRQFRLLITFYLVVVEIASTVQAGGQQENERKKLDNLFAESYQKIIRKHENAHHFRSPLLRRRR